MILLIGGSSLLGRLLLSETEGRRVNSTSFNQTSDDCSFASTEEENPHASAFAMNANLLHEENTK